MGMIKINWLHFLKELNCVTTETNDFIPERTENSLSLTACSVFFITNQ